MKLIADPRCPKHYEYEVNLDWRPNELPSIWSCAVCHRTLGIAAVDRGMGPRIRGRRPIPAFMAFSKIDWAYFVRKQYYWEPDDA